MNRGHDHEPTPQIKRHALLRDIDLGRPLWAGNDADWKKILDNRHSVICDRPGCRGPLVPNNCVKRRRHMSYPQGSRGGCGHHDGPLEERRETDHGMSERHRWMQNYITNLCRKMGYEAKPEHELTGPDGNLAGARADVWIYPARIAVEVQQRPTDFNKRTEARIKGGAAQTIWLISHDANQTTVNKALFSIPAARFKVLDLRLPRKEQWATEFEPWLDNDALDKFASVDVAATTWQLTDERPYLRTCKLDLQAFLREVLEGRRVWVNGDPAMPRSEFGRPRAGWVSLDDLDKVRARIAGDEAAAAAAAAAVELELSGSGESDASEYGALVPFEPAAPKPAVPPAAGRRPVRLSIPPPEPATDWERVADRVAMGVIAILVIVVLWMGYLKVSGWLDEVDAWWSSITHSHAQTISGDRGDAQPVGA